MWPLKPWDEFCNFLSRLNFQKKLQSLVSNFRQENKNISKNWVKNKGSKFKVTNCLLFNLLSKILMLMLQPVLRAGEGRRP